jgi:orotate phosphoribosyltransferase
MTTELCRQLVETGLLQFGRFWRDGEIMPFRLSLDYLPAYPELMQDIADASSAIVARIAGVERLVASPEALPFGMALSLQTGISLVYSRGRSEDAAFDLVGAYNIGHKALLLVNVWENGAEVSALIASAQRVGLEIGTLLALVDIGIGINLSGVTIEPLLRLPSMMQMLAAESRIPRRQAQAVMKWIEQAQIIPRPDAAVP